MTTIALLGGPSAAWSGVSVVVHPDSSINNITPMQAANIFLGKTKTLPNGKLVIPIDQGRLSKIRHMFYKKDFSSAVVKLSLR